MKPTVLVTTAGGRTGLVATIELLNQGYPVRALVHRDDYRAAMLRDAGADVIVGNLYDWRDLRRSMKGVQRAYHCPPFDARHLHGAMMVALAAEEAKLEVIALMSGWNPHPTHPSVVQREHWMANNIYRRLKSVDVVHINPGFFAANYFLGLPAMLHLGMLMLPFGDGLNAPPSNEDIGTVVANVLADPAPYVGRCLRPTGPELLSAGDVADIASKVLKRKVRYQDVPIWMFAKAARTMGFPTFQIAQVRHYAEELRGITYSTGAPTDHVEEVCGRKPENFEAITRRYTANPRLIAPELRAGSLIGALWFSLRMMLTPAPNLDRYEASRDYPLIANGRLAHDDPDWLEAAQDERLLLQPDIDLEANRA